MRTLIEKELRENLRWLLVGLALVGSLLWYAVPKSLAVEIRQTEHGLATMMNFGAALFAIGLGVMQSFSDLRTASRSFLFHRSVSISTIFYSKLISGAVIYFAAVGFPLILVALWFAWQGIDYLPVRPIQVYPAAVVALASFGFHPAAMFMLARSGKWFGTKLLPLVFVVPLILLGFSMCINMMHGLAINLLIVGSILLGIFILVNTARDAWVYSVADEGILSRHPISFASIATLSFAAVILLSIIITFVSVSVERVLRSDSSNVKEDYAIDADGNPWIVKLTGRTYKQNYMSGDRLREDEVPDVRRKLPEKLKLRRLNHLIELRKPASCFENEWRVAGDRQSYFDSRGNVLLYDRTLRPPLQETISRNGKPFAGNPRSQVALMSANILGLLNEDKNGGFWVDQKGVYRFSEKSQELITLVESPVDAMGLFDSSRKPNNESTSNLVCLTFSLLPLLFSIILTVSTSFEILREGKSLPSMDAVSYFVQNECPFVIFAIIVMLLSMLATSYASRRRMLSRSQTVQWCCWAVLLGWATPLAVLAIYTRPTCSQCPRCEKQRRIDLRKCEHCGSEWERPAPMGIEIFDESFSNNTVAQAAS